MINNMTISESPFDLDGLMADLIAFRENVSFHMTDEHPLPDGVSQTLREAFNLVSKAIEDLKIMYDYEEQGWTIYAPSAGKEPSSI